MVKSEQLYEGKAKKIYSVSSSDDLVWVEFKNSLTAFNGEKKAEMINKGRFNCHITSILFKWLEKKGINSHFHERVSDIEMVCQKVKIIPLEVVVRNILAGSTAKKFRIEEGSPLEQPLVEFYYKDDSLGDPFISDEQAIMLKAVNNVEQLSVLKQKALEVNIILKKIFEDIGIDLIDFKLEFGLDSKGEILLADEITPDTCRLWDKKTGERMDKDRFRRDMGQVMEFYEDVFQRLKTFEEKNK
ncbi:MAG: phosphoribosylaminoimidazolesuccinocarboxamide synthase [Bdellovibrionaceae bacterium]|nr:phosphoribosylaminoimidazolesuccinocarboxamide synthase [Pseudobdellovibrionaceae bacterium]